MTSGTPDVGMLDVRAATFEKLNDLQSALKDARMMIKLAKADPRGYLRAGKALQRSLKAPTALQIYEYGLRSVPVSSPLYQVLRSP